MAADGSNYDVVGLDTEFVGIGVNTVGMGGSRNALARVSVVAPGGEVLLDCLVRVPEPVVDFRLSVTGITQEALDQGVHPDEARAWVRHLLRGKKVVGHNLATDWKVLDYLHTPELVRDTAKCKELRPPGKGSRTAKLSTLAALHLNRAVQTGAHNSVEDAATALELYLLRSKEWEASVNSTVALALGPVPDKPIGKPPVDAADVLLQVIAAAEAGGCNEGIAELFATMAGRPGLNTFAAKHFRRVASTFAALPYAVKRLEDLDLPELRCIGKPGTTSRKIVADYVAKSLAVATVEVGEAQAVEAELVEAGSV